MKMMRKLLPALLLCLLLSACDLRNRQSSDYYAPMGGVDLPDGAGRVENDPAQLPETLPGQSGQTQDPELERSQGAIKTVLSYQGQIPMTDPLRYYSYALPMIDLPGSYAAGCNQELERVFGELINQSLEAMERYETPILESLSFTSYSLDGILTLRVDRRDSDGSSSEAYFTVKESNGEQASVKELLAAAGLEGDLESLLTKAITARFENRYGAVTAGDTAATTALTKTLAEIPQIGAQRMHLNADGRLTVAVNLYSPTGNADTEELVLP